MVNIHYKQKGIALITTLVVLNIILILGLAFVTNTWVNYKTSMDIYRQNKAYNSARSGLRYIQEEFITVLNKPDTYHEEKELTYSSFIIDIEKKQNENGTYYYLLKSLGFENKEFTGKKIQITAKFQIVSTGGKEVIKITDINEEI